LKTDNLEKIQEIAELSVTINNLEKEKSELNNKLSDLNFKYSSDIADL